MSNTQYVFIDKSNVPDRAALQQSIDQLGFDLQLDRELQLLRDEGFSPCVLEGVDGVGFELMPMSAEDATDGDEEFLSLAKGRDHCLTFSWRGRMKDCAAAMIVSCALAKDYAGVVSYEGELPEPLDSLMEATRGLVDDARHEA